MAKITIQGDNDWHEIIVGPQTGCFVQNTGQAPVRITYAPSGSPPAAEFTPTIGVHDLAGYSISDGYSIYVRRAGVTDAHASEITYTLDSGA